MNLPPETVCEELAGGTTSQSSFRDPDGRLWVENGRVLRLVHAEAAKSVRDFLASDLLARLTTSGALIRSRVLEDGFVSRVAPGFPEASANGALLVEHERIRFPSYPCEWPPEMLYAAGELTLELAIESLECGFGLKDATPYNVLFRGPDPVFVDVLSFERRDPCDPTWLPYAQFVRTFLLPLLVNRRFGMRLDQTFLHARDGLEPDEVYRWLGPLERLRPPYLKLVTVPAWLNRSSEKRGERLYQSRAISDPHRARFILSSQLRGLKKALHACIPRLTTSPWTGYMAASESYTQTQRSEKEQFIEQVIGECRPRFVLDVGANDGHFSAMFARAGAEVVAVDQDAAVLGSVWRMARREQLPVLPLRLDLTRPTPSAGWRNRECASFLDRAAGAFDCVSLLAVLHHFLVTERVPLEEVISLVNDLTTKYAVIEYVDPADPLFRRLARGRESLHQSLTPQSFETACSRSFRILRSKELANSHRRLYLLERN